MSKQALLIIDMQQAGFSKPPHDADNLVSRINRLSDRLRAKRSPIIVANTAARTATTSTRRSRAMPSTPI